MLIALDFDGTNTEDPYVWDRFIEVARMAGHTVYCVTMRYPSEGGDVIDSLQDKVDKIIFTGRKAKANYLKELGVVPQVWIDDNPHWIYQDALA